MKTTLSDALAALLWDDLRKDPDHLDRRMTAWGSKTQKGLATCILRIVLDNSDTTPVPPPIYKMTDAELLDALAG